MGKMSSLLDAVNKAKAGGAEREDKKFYYPARDAAGNGGATFRFLPAVKGEDLPFVKTFAHGFKGATNKWFIEECPTTIGRDCYCCDRNAENYASLSKEDARKKGMNRKTSYIANIVVIADKMNPENEGKIFQYKFGTKVFNMIADALSPVDEDDTKFNVFNINDDEDYNDLPWPDFKLKIRKVDGETNYDKSEFVKSEKDIKTDLSKCESLTQYHAPERFKTAEELQRRFNIAVGNTQRVAPVKEIPADDIDDDQPVKQNRKAEPAKQTKPAKVDTVDDGDDVEALMRKLAAGTEEDDIPF